MQRVRNRAVSTKVTSVQNPIPSAKIALRMGQQTTEAQLLPLIGPDSAVRFIRSPFWFIFLQRCNTPYHPLLPCYLFRQHPFTLLIHHDHTRPTTACHPPSHSRIAFVHMDR